MCSSPCGVSRFYVRNASQQATQQVGSSDDAPLRAPDQDQIVIDNVVVGPLRHNLQASNDVAHPRVHIPYAHRPVQHPPRSLSNCLNNASRRKWWESSTNAGSPPRSVTMTHFLPEALTRCRKGSSGEGLKAGRTHLPLVSGRLMMLFACTGSPSSVTRKSSRSRKLCT